MIKIVQTFCLLLAFWGPAFGAANAYVANAISNDVSVIDTGTNTVITTITVGLGLNPQGVAVSTDGSRAYVTNGSSNTVSVIDTSSNTVIGNPVAVGATPFGIAVSSDGFRVYTANGGSGTVSVIDTSNNSVVDTVTVGSEPYGIAVSSDGFRVYVANRNSDNVSVIDTSNNMVVDTVTVGASPRGIGVKGDGSRVYVANRTSNTVSVIDTSNNNVIATVMVGTAPTGVAVSIDGSRVYVTNSNSDNVSVIDTGTNTVMATFSVGVGPFGVAVASDGSRVFVVNQSLGTLSVIDTTTNTVVTSVNVGSSPLSLGNFVGPERAETTIAITADTPDPSDTGNAVTVTVEVTGNLAAPTDGQVMISASSGENCTDTTLASGVGNTISFACDLTFNTPGQRDLTSQYSGSATYPDRTSAVESHSVNVVVTVSPTTLPDGVYNSNYNQTLTATGTGSTGPFDFAVTSGSLPPGLTLSMAGLLSGVPTSAGMSTFTVTATDRSGAGVGGPFSGSRAYTIAIDTAAPTISMVSNNGPINEGSSATITVTAPAVGADVLLYSFDCDNNGGFEIGPQASNSSSCSFSDNGLFLVNVMVNDDQTGFATDSTMVTVNNVAPIGVAESNQTDQDTPVGGNLLANEIDPGNDQLSVTSIDGDSMAVGQQTAVTGGGLITVAADGNYTFDPNGEFDDLPDQDSRMVMVNYGIADDDGGTDSSTLTLTVTGLNDAPTADDQSLSLDEEMPLAITLTGSDPDTGDTQTYVADSPDNGMITGTGAAVTYTPDQDFFGDDSFTFTVTDVDGAMDTGTISLTIDPVNDKPTFTLGPDPAFPSGGAGIQSSPNFATDISPGPNEITQTVTGFQVTETSDPDGIVSNTAIDTGGTLSFELSGISGMAELSVEATDSEGATSDPVAMFITVDVPSTDLVVSKTDEQEVVVDGEPITYMITVSNTGMVDVTGAIVEDLLPVELILIDATWVCITADAGAGASCGDGFGNIDDAVNLPAGTSVNYTLTAPVDPDFDGIISNTVTVTAPDGINDFDTGNNSATDETQTNGVFVDGFEEPLVVIKSWLESILDKPTH